MNEEYWKQHMERQQRANDEIRYLRKRHSERVFEEYRQNKRLNNPGKSDAELNIDKPFMNENTYDFWENEIVRLKYYFKKLFHIK